LGACACSQRLSSRSMFRCEPEDRRDAAGQRTGGLTGLLSTAKHARASLGDRSDGVGGCAC
jgi:hypothetical protein